MDFSIGPEIPFEVGTRVRMIYCPRIECIGQVFTVTGPAFRWKNGAYAPNGNLMQYAPSWVEGWLVQCLDAALTAEMREFNIRSLSYPVRWLRRVDDDPDAGLESTIDIGAPQREEILG